MDRQSFKLPGIKFGSVDNNNKAFDTHLWATNERMNLIEILQNDNQIDSEKWQKLKCQIVSILKEAMKGAKLNIWQELHINLLALVPLSGLISQDKEILSLMHLVAEHLNSNIEWSYSLPELSDTLSIFLPKTKRPVINLLDQKNESSAIRSFVRKKGSKAPTSRIMPDDTNNWFFDSIAGDLFDPTSLDMHISIKSKKIKMKDILASIGTVATEIILSESAFERPFEQMIKAMEIDMTRFGYSDVRGIDEELHCVDEYEDLSEDPSKVEKIGVRPEKKGVDLLERPRTGREGVVYMIKCFHLKEMRVAYFNIKPQRIVDYYALTAVKKFQVDPEHFIFSSVGIIHRQPDGSGIAMSLTDWYRDSILYYGLQCIPFVKSFLVRKHFQSWLAFTVHNRHRRKAKHLEDRLLLANLVFGKSMLQILKLLDEISKITLVPSVFTCTHTEVTFLKEFSKVSHSADSYLEKFYKYIKLVVEETAAECYKHLQFCQAQAHNIYLYSDDCIYKKKLKQKERQKALSRSMNQVYKLGDFVRVVNYLLNTTIVAMTLHNIVILSDLMCHMQKDLTKRTRSDKEAIFHTDMVIRVVEGDNALAYSPTVAEIEELFQGAISGIPQLILKHCYPLDGMLSADYFNRYKDVIQESFDRSNRTPAILTSKAEARTQMMENKMISRPEIPFIDLPTKRDDDLRVATPPNVNPNILDKSYLTVFGQALPSKFTPMSSSNVFDILASNQLYRDLTQTFKDLFLETEAQMEVLIKETEWLLDVRVEYNEWSSISMETEWDGQSPYIFEQRLAKVKNFLIQIQSMERTVVIPSRMFVVSLEQIVADLIAEMEFELDSIFDYVLGRVRSMGAGFIEDISVVLEILRLRTIDAECFAKVAGHIVECRERTSRYQASVDYIKALFDVLKVTDKTLGQSDKDIEDQVTSLWESFLFQLQEANEFVNLERTNVILAIKSRIQELENEAKAIAESLNDDLYSILSHDCLSVLTTVKDKLDAMENIKRETDLLMTCYYSLNAEPYKSPMNLDDIIRKVLFLQSQWGLLHNAKKQIAAWKSTLFSQFDVSAASDLILDWQRRIVDMRSQPDHRSNIVKEIEEVVGEFASFMSLFSKLSSPLFQLEHWQRLFSDIGRDFVDPFEVLTVGDLMEMDIRLHSNTVEVLFSNAVLRNKASAEFQHHLRFWMTREFEFMMHSTEPWFKGGHEDLGLASQHRPKSDVEVYYENKSLSERKCILSGLPLTNNQDMDILLVCDFERLYGDISDSLIALPLRGTSSDGGQYSVLCLALEELRTLSQVLEQCQEKWMFLERIFAEEYFVRTYVDSAQRFQAVNGDLLAFLRLLHSQPTAIQHTHSGQVFLALKSIGGSDGGLVHRLTDISHIIDDIISSLVTVLDKARDVFPRLYFLPDSLVVKALSTDASRGIDHILPIITLCFPHVANVSRKNTLTICSHSDESVPLIKEMSKNHLVPTWLNEFEYVMKCSMKSHTASCVAQQMTEGGIHCSTDKGSAFFLTERPRSTVFDEIDQIESLATRMSKEKQVVAGELVQDILTHYQSWLLRYPLQTLLLVENIVFYKSIKDSLMNGSHNLKDLRTKLIQKESNLLRINNAITMDSRSRVALERLILANQSHADILDKLMEDQDLSLHSFSYKSLIKYEVDMAVAQITKPLGADIYGDVSVEVLGSRFVYEYEYIDVWHCDPINTGITERSILNMLISMNNHEVGAIVGGTKLARETFQEVSRILGRNMFSVLCCPTMCHGHIERMVKGALLSGSLLHLDNFERLHSSVVSGLSRDIWLIREELKKVGDNHVLHRKIRPLSAMSTCIKTDDDDFMRGPEKTLPHSSRDSFPKRNTDVSLSRLRETNHSSMTRGRTWLPHHDDDLVQGYCPRVLGQIHLYNGLLDIRYGFGLLSSFDDGHAQFQEVPLSMKTQMRTHCLIAIDEVILWKQHLVLAGPEHQEELVACVDLFIQRTNDLLPSMAKSVKRLLSLAMSSVPWHTNDHFTTLGKHLYDSIIERLSPDQDIRHILRDLVIDSFYVNDTVVEGAPQDDSSALVHQIKSQLRVRGLKVTQGCVDTMIELRKAVQHNNIVFITGGSCTGKTLSVDVLSAAINGLCSSTHRVLSASKKRGAIDILKSLSEERKAQGDIDDRSDTVGQRIYLLRLSLSNFTTQELYPSCMDQGPESLDALTAILRPLLKATPSEKFQIWLHIDQNLNQHSEMIYPILRLFENEPCVKILIECNSPPVHLMPDLVGLVQMPHFQVLWKTILKKNIKQLLAQKIISYYGCKLLSESGELLLHGVFKSINLQLRCAKDEGIYVNCIQQICSVLEIMLRQYSKYNPSDKEDNLTSIDRKYTSILCFSIIQGVRGTLYSVLIGQRLLSPEEFEEKLISTLSGTCEISTMKDEVNVGIFGVMLDFNSLSMKPYEDVKGCRLPELWCNADGVAKYVLDVMVKYRRCVRVSGAPLRVEALLGSVRFNKRLHLTRNISVIDLRRCLGDVTEQYWKIVSNEDPLTGKSRDNDVILIETFHTEKPSGQSPGEFLPFVLEHKYFYDGEYFEKVRIDDAMLIVVDHCNGRKALGNYSKMSRWSTEINIIDPSFLECRHIAYKCFARWLTRIDKHKDSFSKGISKHIADFLMDIAVCLRHYRIQQIMDQTCSGSHGPASIDLVTQVTWDHLTKIIRTLTTVPIDVLQSTVRFLESTFPIEKTDIGKNYRKYAIYIRIIRHCVFEVSRTFVDCADHPDDITAINEFIHDSIVKNLSHVISENIEDMVLKHYPVPVARMTDIVMWPCRLIEPASYKNNSHVNYQPIAEAHCWQMLNKVQENISNVAQIKDHIEENPHLVTLTKSYDCLVNVIKMYKHLSTKNCRPSALFVQHSSSLIKGKDYGIFLSGLLSALYVHPEDLLATEVDLLREAVQLAGRSEHKVVLHIDDSCTRLTDDTFDMITGVLNQDSLAPLLQYLQLPYLHRFIRDLHKDLYVINDSQKEIRLAKAFLENVQRNLKILVTCSTTKILNDEKFRCLATYFKECALNYIKVEDYSEEIVEESLAYLIGHPPPGIASTLARVHRSLTKYFRRFKQLFGSSFATNGAHLKLISSLYNYFYNMSVKSIKEEMEIYRAAVASVEYSRKELDVMKNLKTSLQEDLKRLTEEVEISGAESKNMRDMYAGALVQCKNQEKMVAELFGPLNDMKEKSKSNLDDVSPTYLAALDTIRNLDPDAVEEIKTYVKPPQQVKDLIAIIFDLLGYETNWELIKERMVKINVYEELLYLDKDHISDENFRKLETSLLDPRLQTDNLESVSRAAASLSKWLCAVYRYSSLNKDINPQLGQLLSCQDQINRAQTELGKMRVRADLMRQELEKKIGDHKRLLASRKSVADSLKNISYKINSGTNLLSDMSTHIDQWAKTEASLRAELECVSTRVMNIVIRCVYLNKLPHSLQNTVLDHLRSDGINIKEEDHSRLIREEDYRDILQERAWSSVHRNHLRTVVELVAAVRCPGIVYPALGSVIMVHCCQDGCQGLEQMLLSVLEFGPIRCRLGDPKDAVVVHYKDCSKAGVEGIDDMLMDCMRQGSLLVLDKVHLLTQLTPGLLALFNTDTDTRPSVHHDFRLLLITNNDYCIDDYSCCGFLSTERFLHFTFAIGASDFEDLLKTILVETCEKELHQNILNCNIQRYELDGSSFDEKQVLTNIAMGCSKEAIDRPSVKSDKLSPVFEKSSLLEVEGLHSILLQIDSKLLTFDESRDSIREKEKLLQARLEKYESMVMSVSLLLRRCGMFQLDHVMSRDGNGRTTEYAPARVSLTNIIEIIKEVSRNSSMSIVMTNGSDPEITETFLQKLERAIMMRILGEFYVSMEPSDLIEGVLEYCIDKIVDECKELEGWTESEAGFLRQAIMCVDASVLIQGVDTGAMDIGALAPDCSVPKETLLLSLILETNVVVLGGLTKSFMIDQKLWTEYFKFPFMSCNLMPGFDVGHQPSLLLKAVVWRLLNPAKMTQVRSAIISDVFGEDIFTSVLPRARKFELMLSGCTPTHPIIVTTMQHVMSGIESPLELITRCYEPRRNSVKIRIIDCSSKADLDRLLAPSSVGESSSISHILLEPTWLVLSNFHLCAPDYFSCKYFRVILKIHLSTWSRNVHRDSRLFLTLELNSSTQFPESLLSVGRIYHCSPVDAELFVEEFEPYNIDNDLSKDIVALVHTGVFSSSSFKHLSVATYNDYRQSMKITAHIQGSARGIVNTLDLIYRNKTREEALRRGLGSTLVSMSHSINEYMKSEMSKIVLQRDFHANLQINLTRYKDADINSEKSIRMMNDMSCLVDQRTLGLVKESVQDIVKQLLLIYEQPIVEESMETQQHMLRMDLRSIIGTILGLPVWRLRSPSILRFDERLTQCDVVALCDQPSLSNDVIPGSWVGVRGSNTISQWLTSLKTIVDSCSEMISRPTTTSIDDVLLKVRDHLRPGRP